MSDTQIPRPYQLTKGFGRRMSVPIRPNPKESHDVRSASVTGTLVDRPQRRKTSLASLTKLGRKPKSKPIDVVEHAEHIDLPQEKQPNITLLSLPNELLLQVLCELTYSLSDILSLRLASKSMHVCINANSLTITKALVRDYHFQVPYDSWKTIYPLPEKSGSLRYILEAQQRQHTIVKTCSALADFIQFEIYRNRSSQFLPKRRRIEHRLQVPVLIIHHFLSQLKAHLVDRVYPSEPEPKVFPNQSAILADYPPRLLPTAFQTSKILFSVFRQKLRAPTYAGSVERTLRGWNYPPATDLELSQIAVYGGLEAMIRVIAPSKYAARLDLAQEFITDLHRSPKGSETGLANDGHPLDPQSNWKEWKATLEELPTGAELFIAPTRQKLIDDNIVGPHEEIPRSFQWIEGLVNDEEWNGESEV